MKNKFLKFFKILCKKKIILGHNSSLRNPKMSKYIILKNKRFDIINPLKILKYKRKAQNFLRKCAYTGGKILFIGTKKQAKSKIQKYADQVKMPYINYKWPAGLLTNIDNTKTTIEKKNYLKNIDPKLLKYLSKKEKILIKRKYDSINKKFGTILNMNELPTAVIIVDVKRELIALKEANKSAIYTIGIIDTDSNPDGLDIAIPANDDLSKSIDYILRGLTSYIKKGLIEKKNKKLHGEKKNKKNT